MRPEIVKISSQEPEPSLVSYVAEKIRAGEVLGMPTDTFYGSGGRSLQFACR